MFVILLILSIIKGSPLGLCLSTAALAFSICLCYMAELGLLTKDED